jgi:RHS repeat-associated protein
MAEQSGGPASLIATPKGGGALQGIGEKFSPDLFTGTGNFAVPIALPPGRNGFQPELNLVYSTGNGNGPFGLGWGLSVPGVARRTSKGIPRYDDENDVFILSGAEDLVPVAETAEFKTYRPRTEGLFARVRHYKDAENDYWRVESKDGLVSYYGMPHPGDANPDWRDPAVIADPDPGKRDKIFAWKLTRTEDPFGNLIVYEYERDSQCDGPHHWDQLYLKRIRYVDYKRDEKLKFLVSVNFHYEDRTGDPFSEYRPGFEIRTRQRCTSIEIRTHPDRHCDVPQTGILVRTYQLVYLDQREGRQEQLPLNGVSLLNQIKVVGHDESQETEEDRIQALPPLEFGYTSFEPQGREFFPLTGVLPARSLADSDLELVDLFGNGLPDVLEMNGTVRYWRNLGKGEFDLPREMSEAPAGLSLADKGIQLIDADGNGRADLLVTTEAMSGYYPTRFGGSWDRRSYQRYRTAPSFDLEDPEVRLVDLDGDGVTDAVRSGARLECFFNDPKEGWKGTRWVEGRTIEDFPNINFSDPRVKWADMSGDGLTDIVLVNDGNLEYWPNLGHGDWAPRVSMRNCPRFPYGYDPRRIQLGDVDGDGLADIVYVDDTKVTLWINQSGNRWSAPIEIRGTPPVSDMDAVRLVDLLGSGIGGVLWSQDAGASSREHYYFLDFTGGLKPYLLHEMDNHTGALTCVEYAPSTSFYLEDRKRPESGWKTPLPFPVQVVSRVEVLDHISQGKLTTEYSYHHGYWDGTDREFRGFGRVDQRDTEVFERYHEPGLHGNNRFIAVTPETFSPPLETRTWFHQGPIGDALGGWDETDFTPEFWTSDPSHLSRPAEMEAFLRGLPRPAQRDALRTLRGRILRTELYALDGRERQDHPYTVTEYLHGVTSLPVGDPWPAEREPWQEKVFFPHALGQRVTQWERGDDPMTQFSFTEDYDQFGQPQTQVQIACPRGWREPDESAGEDKPYLATCSRTVYAVPPVGGAYIHDRVAKTTTWEIDSDSNGDKSLLELREMADEPAALPIVSQVLNFYDGDAFVGRGFKQVGEYGAPVRSESLVLTDECLWEAYKSGEDVQDPPEMPPYLKHNGSTVWSEEYPAEFRTGLLLLAGYTPHAADPDLPHATGYFATTERRQYDFQVGGTSHGLLLATRDPLGNETTIAYQNEGQDLYHLLPTQVTDPAGLTTRADYDYRVLQPKLVTDPNGNRTAYGFTALGLLKHTAVMGKVGEAVGDWLAESGDELSYEPSTRLEYDFLAFHEQEQPISVRTIRREHHINEPFDDESERDNTIETVEYSDGFGRLLQTRTQAEDVLFGDPVFGNGVLPPDQEEGNGANEPVVGRRRAPNEPPNVVVSGWQRYDNKGQVVEKYEPFYSKGFDYLLPEDEERYVFGQKVTMFYDPRGQVIRTENPDGSQQRVIYGVPGSIDEPDLSNPEVFEPTPWLVYTYDPNDNAQRTHPDDSVDYAHCYDTPASALVDALGRTVETVERNRTGERVDNEYVWSDIEEYRTVSTYDIRGNLLAVKDAMGRLAFEHVYDLADNPLRIKSIDAGIRRTILDAAGNEIERRDGKGALILQGYDLLNRPMRLWARDDEGQAVTLRERILYGDSAEPDAPEDPTADNLLGKPYKHYDEAGLLTFKVYDFKGNLTEKIREVASDAAIEGGWIADWGSPIDEGCLEGFAYQTNTNYDALNRPTKITYPAEAAEPGIAGPRAVLVPSYNRAGALESVRLDGESYVTRIAYNAKGQRVLIAYGNEVMTRYAYDEQTFRLERLRSERFTQPDDLSYQPQGATLQAFHYDYDLAGNILHINDRAPGCGLPGHLDELARTFVYDPIYRLIYADGREHDRQQPVHPPWTDIPTGTDPNDTRFYSRDYQYDPAGNLRETKHGANGNGNNFSRLLEIVPGNNRLHHVSIGQTTYAYDYDDNGNMIQEATNRHFAWDHADRMKTFINTPAGSEHSSVEARYLYGADGMRVKKWVRKNGNSSESTVYIDGIFEHHCWWDSGSKKQNNHLHVMDDQQRIAIVRRGEVYSENAWPEIQYHLGDHLGSSNVVVNGDGQWINREEYFAYGETSFGSFAKKRYRFTGKERDEESTLYYHGIRYYSRYIGRWLSCDRMRRKNSINPYAYVGGNPIALFDPTGLQEEEPPLIPKPISEWTAEEWQTFMEASGAEIERKRNTEVIGEYGGEVYIGSELGWEKHKWRIDTTKQLRALDAITGSPSAGIAAIFTRDPDVILLAASIESLFMSTVAARAYQNVKMLRAKHHGAESRIALEYSRGTGFNWKTRSAELKKEKQLQHTYMTQQRANRQAKEARNPPSGNQPHVSLLSPKYGKPTFKLLRDIYTAAQTEIQAGQIIPLRGGGFKVHLYRGEITGWVEQTPCYFIEVVYSKGGWHYYPITPETVILAPTTPIKPDITIVTPLRR